jgi:hypothetical protein
VPRLVGCLNNPHTAVWGIPGAFTHSWANGKPPQALTEVAVRENLTRTLITGKTLQRLDW